MKVELTDQEIQLILQALNSVGVRGVESMRAVVALIEKLTSQEDTQDKES